MDFLIPHYLSFGKYCGLRPCKDQEHILVFAHAAEVFFMIEWYEGTDITIQIFIWLKFCIPVNYDLQINYCLFQIIVSKRQRFS